MMNRTLLSLGISLSLGGALLTAPATSFAEPGEKTPVKDTWITANAKIALAADPRVKGTQVSVNTTKGLVILRGKVDTREASEAAETVTKALDGVKRVKNELQVVAPSRREAVDDKDDAITLRVKEQIAKDAYLTKDKRLKIADIGVKSNAGVVSLTGEVPDLLVSAQATWTAWQVAGVRSVKNDLTLKP